MFLRLKDYERSIQLTELAEMLRAGGDNVRLINELSTLEEVQSYLRQRYDVAEEFADTVVYSPTTTYNGLALTYLDASAWSGTPPYSVNDLVLRSGNVYISIQAGTNQDPLTQPTFWKLLGAQYAFFYVTLPYAEFNYLTFYNVGDKVTWNNKVYQAIQDSPTLDEQTKIQYLQYSSIPRQNVFPDDPDNGAAFWGTGVTFSLSGLLPSEVVGDYSAWSAVTTYNGTQKVSYGGVIYQSLATSLNITPGTDITKWVVISWTNSDNRNQKLVEVMVDVACYKINKQLAPRNVTQSRIDAYDFAIAWLDMARKGEVQTNIPVLQPKSGRRVRFGGNIKLQNNY